MDCLEGLKHIKDGSMDLIFADPPYNIGKDYGIYKDKMKPEDYYSWCEKWLKECIRVLKNTGCLFVMNYPEHLAYFKVFLDKHLKFVNWITWIRNDNQFYNKNRQFKRNHQDILFYVPDKKMYYFNWRAVSKLPKWPKDKRIKDLAGQTDTWDDITIVKGNSKEKTGVNNQLPLELLRRVILATTDKGFRVLDPFAGSGSTAVVCKQLGRNFVGFEINPVYVEICNERLKSTG